MKPNLPLQARMLGLYHRFKQSNLTRAAFCREAGITAAQFTYWCRRFEQERKTFPENQVAELTPATPGFTQLHLPDTPVSAVHSVFPTPAISTFPLIVLDLAGKGRLEFYTAVEASFLKTLLF